MATTHKFTTRQLFSFGFFGLAAILFVVGIGSAVSTGVFLSEAAEATGRVVEFRRVQSAAPLTDPESGIVYYPVITFETREGREVTFEADQGRLQRTYSVGETVAVLYPVEEPEGARVRDLFGLWGRALVLGGTGLLFALIGVIYVRGFGLTGRF